MDARLGRPASAIALLAATLAALVAPVGTTSSEFKSVEWLLGDWVGEFSGKVRWPTIPTMTYGETLSVHEAPYSAAVGVRFLNFTARSWSYTTKDHLHDEWGYLSIKDGRATLMTTGNNGFNKYEEGPVSHGFMELKLKDIGRVTFSRDLPVMDMKRTFTLLGPTQLEQTLFMRTETHPKRVGSLLEHSRIVYDKIRST